MVKINTVTVIGVTGTMGANVAGIFASFGNAKVYCIGRDINKVKKTIPRIVNSVRADSISANLVPADFSMLEQCVSESDLVFESSAERIDVKTDIATKVGRVLPSHAVSCTGSSGLSITLIAECYPPKVRSHFFGVHMFNPPYSMSLCELTPTKYSDLKMFEELEDYLKNVLIRTVVEVKDSPAFLANRIGFQFINEAMQYAETYKDNGGVDYIDAILGSFTGRSMPPLATADFVGLDVHKAIVDNIYENTSDFAHDTFILPDYVRKLICEKKLGKKSGEGLYKTIRYDNGLKRSTVFDLNTGVFRDKMNYVFPFSEEMKKYIKTGDYDLAFKSLVNNHSQEANICLHFLVKYIVYSFYATAEVGYSMDDADDVMATGFNWCPPQALYHVLSTITDVKQLIHEHMYTESLHDLDGMLSGVQQSKYDYRSFFKSEM